jgi:hypothetical protein
VIGAAVYLGYILTEKNINTNAGLVQTEEVQNFAVIVERNYDVPVTYPYQSGMFTGFFNALNTDIFKKEPVEEQPQSKQFVSSTEQTQRTEDVEIRESLPAVRVKGYIYRYEDGVYAAQLSSWKSKSIAISETKKYLDAGYKAFLEKTLRAEGVYYRVRVGGFNSMEEAEQFLKKNN